MNSPDAMNIDLNQSMNNNENGEELMGKVFVEVSSELSLQGFEFGASSVFVNAPAATQSIDLESDKGNFWVAPSVEEEADLQAGLTQSVLYAKDY